MGRWQTGDSTHPVARGAPPHRSVPDLAAGGAGVLLAAAAAYARNWGSGWLPSSGRSSWPLHVVVEGEGILPGERHAMCVCFRSTVAPLAGR